MGNERMKFYECRGCLKVLKETELGLNEATMEFESICPWCQSEDLEEIVQEIIRKERRDDR